MRQAKVSLVRSGPSGSGRLGFLGLGVACAALMALAAAGSAPALGAACPNEAVREQQQAGHLSDCRAYEQVTPVDKEGGEPSVNTGLTRASLAGDVATFTSADSFAGGEGAPQLNYFRAVRTAGGWVTRGITPSQPVSPELAFTLGARFLGWTPDLSQAVLRSWVPLTGDATPNQNNLYLQDFSAGSRAVFTPTPLDATPFDLFSNYAAFAGGSADFERIVFESSKQLTPDAAPGVPNAYERTSTGVRLAGVLPASEGGGAPSEGSSVGIGATNAGGLGARPSPYNDGAVSRDGSRVFFTTPARLGLEGVATGRLYVRKNGEETTLMTASRRTDCADSPGSCSGTPAPDPAGAQPARFWTATPDGAFAFFTSAEELTDDANTGTATGNDLYRFDVESGELVDLSVDAGSADGARVLGVLGVGEDGRSVYFAARGVLAAGGVEGEENLYLWRDGSVSHIATGLAPVNVGESIDQSPSWTYVPSPDGRSVRVSRVSADGTRVLFQSSEKLTAYDSSGFAQLYLYDANSDTLTCVSCPPAGVKATAPVGVEVGTNGFEAPEGYLPRILSADGSRVLFSSRDPLVPEDTNGLLDVYEYVEGRGVSLLSDGKSAAPAYLLDADASGATVLIGTRARLSSTDRDGDVDIYAVRAGGGFLAAAAPPLGCAKGGCGPTGAAPSPATPGSALVQGVAKRKHSRACSHRAKARHRAGARKRPHEKAKKRAARCRAKGRS